MTYVTGDKGIRITDDQLRAALFRSVWSPPPSTPQLERRRRRAAVHEAGHAVVAEVLDLRVLHVTIAPIEDNLGHTALVEPFDSRQATLGKLRRVGVISLAGLTAERVILGRRGRRWREQPDRLQALDYALQLTACHVSMLKGRSKRDLEWMEVSERPDGRSLDTSGDQWMEVLWDEAYDLVHTHRVALEKLVAELLDREIVFGRRVREIVRDCGI